ncbi:MAG: hypothetical protein F4Y04_00380 [Chloroflexi bacterium]|nr:hypothetical protein [Chloroflexota bacterium]
MNLLKTLATLVVGLALLALPSAAQYNCWDPDLWDDVDEEECDFDEEGSENKNTPDDTDTGDLDDVNDPGDFTADSPSGDDFDELDQEELSELVQTFQPPEPTQDLDGTGFGEDTDDEYWEEIEYNSCVDDAGETHTENTASCAGADDYEACTESVDDSYSEDVSSCD